MTRQGSFVSTTSWVNLDDLWINLAQCTSVMISVEAGHQCIPDYEVCIGMASTSSWANLVVIPTSTLSMACHQMLVHWQHQFCPNDDGHASNLYQSTSWVNCNGL